MNAIDTNALVRFLIVDDEKQAHAIRQILFEAETKGATIFISAAVVLETIWVLSSAYNLSNVEIIKAMETILAMPVFVFETQSRMVALCRIAPSLHIDLADVFIGLSAQESGCETTFTFDRKASKSGLFTLIQCR